MKLNDPQKLIKEINVVAKNFYKIKNSLNSVMISPSVAKSQQKNVILHDKTVKF